MSASASTMMNVGFAQLSNVWSRIFSKGVNGSLDFTGKGQGPGRLVGNQSGGKRDASIARFCFYLLRVILMCPVCSLGRKRDGVGMC